MNGRLLLLNLLLAAGVMVLLGVQLAFLFLPVADIGTISLGPQLGVPMTILLTVLTGANYVRSALRLRRGSAAA